VLTIGPQRLRASACPRHPEDGQIKTVDACGFPIAFQLTGGEVHDAKAAPDLIKILLNSPGIRH